MSIREQILNADDNQRERVFVPEWGINEDTEPVYVIGLTASGRDLWETDKIHYKNFGQKNQSVETNFGSIRAGLVARSLVDEDGNLIFTEKDIDALGKKSAKVMDRIYAISAKRSGVNDEDLEEMEKNSEAVPIGSTVSPLPTDGEGQDTKS